MIVNNSEQDSVLCLMSLANQSSTEIVKPLKMVSTNISVFVIVCYALVFVAAHGPPSERDNEDVVMGRKVKKMSGKWCSMAKACNHDRVPVCGVSHAGDLMGFRDRCDMFDFNCIRRRNYKQTSCPDDKSVLTASRRPVSSYYDD